MSESPVKNGFQCGEVLAGPNKKFCGAYFCLRKKGFYKRLYTELAPWPLAQKRGYAVFPIAGVQLNSAQCD